VVLHDAPVELERGQAAAGKADRKKQKRSRQRRGAGSALGI
jgi:hypothetical protein